jgi:hypothetical protein
MLRAAHVAQQSGQGPMMDLLKAAVAKAGNNPHVWLGAYSLIIEEGLEDEIPEAHDWLNRALGYQPFLQELYDKPSFDSFIRCTPAFYTVGVTKAALAASHEVMSQLQKEETRLAEGFTPHIIQTLSFVAMQTQDEKLADAVAEFCVEKTRELTDDDGTAEIISRLLECASAIPDREKAMNDLALRLERIAYLAPTAVSADHYDSLSHLQILADGLSEKLGKALAASRLGRRAA